jgi:uncharacterized protein (TIGR00269 family)
MKCRKCTQKATIHMRQHKLALCSGHYLEWFLQQTQRFIQKYNMFDPGKRILVAVSGGKDSLALWDVLHRLEYQVDGLYINLGINEKTSYSLVSMQKAKSFACLHGLHLIVMDVLEEEGASIAEAASLTLRGRSKPCSICGLTKRHFMNRIGFEHGYDVLATGHNLDDEVAVLFGNTLNWQSGYLIRQNPVLESNPEGFVRKVKPFFRFYERETAAYTFLRGIDYIQQECPYAMGAKTIYYKEVLSQMETKRPGLKLNFYLSFLRAKEKGLFLEENDHHSEDLHLCETCGQPTSAPQKCTYCRTWERVRSGKASRSSGAKPSGKV